MNPKLILILALVLGGGLVSCSTMPARTDTKVFDCSNSRLSVVENNVVTGLGSGFSIRAAADSWPALIEKTKPAFAWNGCDMMWIEAGTNDRPQFVLDEACILSAHKPAATMGFGEG